MAYMTMVVLLVVGTVISIGRAAAYSALLSERAIGIIGHARRALEMEGPTCYSELIFTCISIAVAVWPGVGCSSHVGVAMFAFKGMVIF